MIRKPEKFSRWILVVVKIFSAGCCCIFLSSISLSFQNTPKTDRQDSASVVIDRLDGPDPCLDKPLKLPTAIVSQQESQMGILVNVPLSL